MADQSRSAMVSTSGIDGARVTEATLSAQPTALDMRETTVGNAM